MNIFVLSAIPFFMFAGELMNESGLIKNIIKLVNVFVGKIRGGLAQVNVIDILPFILVYFSVKSYENYRC